jgi:hypothetical protein
MEQSMKLFMCALLLGPVVALAQEEPAVEEIPADQPPAEEAAPAAEGTPQESEPEAEGPAFPGEGFIDVFYVPTSALRISGGGTRDDQHGDGFGGRGLYRFSRHFGVSGEYQALSYDKVRVDVNESRLAVGAIADNSDGGMAGLFIEYDSLKTDPPGDTTDGFSLHGRVSGTATSWLHYYLDLAYLRLKDDVEDLTGTEFTLGGLCSFGRFGVFADVRRTQLDGEDSDARSSIADARAGVRLSFGGAAQSEP